MEPDASLQHLKQATSGGSEHDRPQTQCDAFLRYSAPHSLPTKERKETMQGTIKVPARLLMKEKKILRACILQEVTKRPHGPGGPGLGFVIKTLSSWLVPIISRHSFGDTRGERM